MSSNAKASIAAIWTIAHSALYGFHITSLNGVQASVVCSDQSTRGTRFGLRECLDLSDSAFGAAVTLLTLGGLIGTLVSDWGTRRLGRIGVLRVSEVLFAVGTAFVGLANGLIPLVIGRLLIGIASGLVLVTVPLHLSEIAPKRFSRIFGTLHQISIGLGMIVAQCLSFSFDKLFLWRYVQLVGASIAIALALFSFFMSRANRKNDRGDSTDERGITEESSLLSDRDSGEEVEPLSVMELFKTENSVIRKALFVVVAAQFAQQVCGISPVMYFSTKILGPVFMDSSKLVALFVMAIGIPFNFVPGCLPQAFTTKRMLLASSALTALFSLLLGIGLNLHNQILSGLSVVAFVISFSLGLAPMAWVILPEVMPKEGRTAGSSVAVSVNWITNFVAGSSFLPLQQWLKHGDEGEGYIFFVFAVASIVAFIGIGRTCSLYERTIANQ